MSHHERATEREDKLVSLFTQALVFILVAKQSIAVPYSAASPLVVVPTSRISVL